HAPAEFLEAFGSLQIVHDLLQISLHALQARDVGERNRLPARLVALRGTLAKSREESAAHQLVARAAIREPEEQEQEERNQKQDRIEDQHRIVGRRVLPTDVFFLKQSRKFAKCTVVARQADSA